MSDFRMAWSDEFGAIDLVVSDTDIELDEGLETAALVSRAAHRRAREEDALIDENDRRGWWGDAFSEVEGDQIGSRLWLLERGLLTPQYEVQAGEYERQAFAWMTEDGVAADVAVTVTTDDTAQSATTVITITRPSGDTAEFRYTSQWEATIAV